MTELELDEQLASTAKRQPKIFEPVWLRDAQVRPAEQRSGLLRRVMPAHRHSCLRP